VTNALAAHFSLLTRPFIWMERKGPSTQKVTSWKWTACAWDQPRAKVVSYNLYIKGHQWLGYTCGCCCYVLEWRQKSIPFHLLRAETRLTRVNASHISLCVCVYSFIWPQTLRPALAGRPREVPDIKGVGGRNKSASIARWMLIEHQKPSCVHALTICNNNNNHHPFCVWCCQSNLYWLWDTVTPAGICLLAIIYEQRKSMSVRVIQAGALTSPLPIDVVKVSTGTDSRDTISNRAIVIVLIYRRG
jgi:hypothetical protein